MSMSRLSKEDCAKTLEDLASASGVALFSWRYRNVPGNSGQSPPNSSRPPRLATDPRRKHDIHARPSLYRRSLGGAGGRVDYKHSGMGRENGSFGITEYTNAKFVSYSAGGSEAVGDRTRPCS
jgi:hypothetical protein